MQGCEMTSISAWYRSIYSKKHLSSSSTGLANPICLPWVGLTLCHRFSHPRGRTSPDFVVQPRYCCGLHQPVLICRAKLAKTTWNTAAWKLAGSPVRGKPSMLPGQTTLGLPTGLFTALHLPKIMLSYHCKLREQRRRYRGHFYNFLPVNASTRRLKAA